MRNCDVRFKLTLSTKRQELTRFHRKKCGNEGAEKKRKLKRVKEIKGGKGKENRENEGGEEREEGEQKQERGKRCRTNSEINISRVSSSKVFNLGVINSQLFVKVRTPRKYCKGR